MKFYTINEKYLDFLRKYDKNISYTLNYNKNRPFIGIVIKDNSNIEYYIPITSKHKKYSNVTTEPINNGKNGYILFNNMIPVKSNNVKELDLTITKADNKKDISLKLMRKFELKDINNKKTKIIKKANNLLKLYNKWDDNNPLKLVCCNFPLLETKCKEYSKILIQQEMTQESEQKNDKVIPKI